MNSTKPRGEVSPRTLRMGASLPWVVGAVLCFGLWSCGSGTGHEETPAVAAPAATEPAAAAPTGSAETSVPNQETAATSEVTPDPRLAALPPVQAQARGTSQSAHLALTGDQKYEGDARSTCALFPNKTFQIALNIPGAPFFVLRIENFHGAGVYDSDARVRANFSGEVVRQSRGVAKTTITVVKSAQPGGPDAISGSFSGPYQGDAGKGTVTGNFERCLYELPEFNG